MHRPTANVSSWLNRLYGMAQLLDFWGGGRQLEATFSNIARYMLETRMSYTYTSIKVEDGPIGLIVILFSLIFITLLASVIFKANKKQNDLLFYVIFISIR